MKYPVFSFFLPAFAALLLTGQVASADIYKYIDDQGRVHYANSLESVPPRYRKQVEIKEELKSSPQEPAGTPAVAAPAPATSDGSNGANDFGESKAAALKAQEQSIQKEFEALKAEQAELIRLKEAADTPDKIENYHRKMERFQERFDAFHERRKAFEKEAREYNEKVRQSIEQTLKTLEAGEKQK
ncbi:DUF4124 domain-containing protein [Desulfosudis oleivorans]|uniref:DUF4124 domain-containing protein n=1 Tax=Desulfosudis oleivorans (strain DSM 6200 / JCM 39069 / Hxd3) TaxID=96561 RepID=A8ZUZ7_DESOH|nr:DUF4124 domain-containing protein [Desulfosudis oleivorans]ABW68087.1 hypothetical protein Dole_2283 [Desulfosudis oleivorans Hxd3]